MFCNCIGYITLNNIRDWLHWVNLKKWRENGQGIIPEFYQKSWGKPHWCYLVSQLRTNWAPLSYKSKALQTELACLSVLSAWRTNHINILKTEQKDPRNWVPVKYFSNCNIHNHSRRKVARYEPWIISVKLGHNKLFIAKLTWWFWIRKAPAHEHRNVRHEVLLLNMDILWIRWVVFPWQLATQPLKHVITKDF
jgi:hypothetical protein